MNVTITRVGSTEAHVRAPYELRDICKDIPSRTWQKDLKVWAIDADYIDFARRLFELEGHRVQVLDGRRRTTTPPPPRPAAVVTDWATALFESIPPTLHEKAYKALVKVLHPDAGGNTRSAQQLIDAYSRRS